MVDVFIPEKRSQIMSSIKGKNTKPEMVVRRLLHGAGYRFKVHVKILPGKPDLYFSSRKKAVFVNGCFWHGHKGCRRASVPKSNKKFWGDKIRNNVHRDLKKHKELADMGIESFVVWECELSNIDKVMGNLKGFLGAPKHS